MFKVSHWRLTYDRKETKQSVEFKTEYHILSNISYAAHTIQLHQAIEHENLIYTLETGVLSMGQFFYCSFGKNSTQHANYESHIIPKSGKFAPDALEVWFLQRLKSCAENGGQAPEPVAAFDNATKKINVL